MRIVKIVLNDSADHRLRTTLATRLSDDDLLVLQRCMENSGHGCITIAGGPSSPAYIIPKSSILYIEATTA